MEAIMARFKQYERFKVSTHIVIGTVTFFNSKGLYGFAKTPEGDYHFHMNACRKIVAGPTTPDFGFGSWGAWPKFGDMIVIMPPEIRRYTGKAPSAQCWGYQSYWNKVQEEILNRPLYRVLGENRFKGQVMAKRVRSEVIETGTMEELASKYPRGVSNDPLGTETPYRTGPCSRISRWVIRVAGRGGEDDRWVACSDPRPVPTSLMRSMPTASAEAVAA
jgi:hypothetical protein